MTSCIYIQWSLGDPYMSVTLTRLVLEEAMVYLPHQPIRVVVAQSFPFEHSREYQDGIEL